jgi:hypothetical protein
MARVGRCGAPAVSPGTHASCTSNGNRSRGLVIIRGSRCRALKCTAAKGMPASRADEMEGPSCAIRDGAFTSHTPAARALPWLSWASARGAYPKCSSLLRSHGADRVRAAAH